MPPPRPAPASTEHDGTIHLVRGGKTLCRIFTYEMNKKHRWVELYGFDAPAATCKECLEVKAMKEAGVRVRR